MDTCKNNYKNSEEFFESYGSEDSVNNCGGCPYFTYDSGTITCSKFNNPDGNYGKDE